MFKALSITFLGFCLAGAAIAKSDSTPPKDAFRDYFANQVEAATDLPYDVKVWAQDFAEGNYRQAGHLWGAVETQLPGEMRNLGDAAYLDILWHLGLDQTFVEQWLSYLARKDFRDSPALLNLERTVASTFDTRLENSGVIIPRQDLAVLGNVPDRPVYRIMRAWSSLRGGLEAEPILNQLPENHPWRPWLVRTVVLAKAEQGKVSQAISLLKGQLAHPPSTVDPLRDDPNIYYLQLGRLYYQQGNLREAEQWYTKIPRGSPQFLAAQEELSWVWLREGQGTKLRGAVKSLSLPLFKDKIAPEAYVVHAISDLKLCYFDDVEKDFRAFIADNTTWAQEVDAQLKATSPKRPPDADWYSRLIEQALDKRRAEEKTVSDLRQESIAAALPAVGKQAHWEKAKEDLQVDITQLEKQRDLQYRRQWRAYALMIQEAIRKLRFVKLELMSELTQGSKQVADSKRTEESAKRERAAIDSEIQDQWSFPFDGVVWADELFRLRSVASNQCL